MAKWQCLASGGLAVIQLDETGEMHAATLGTKSRHVAVHSEFVAMAVAAVEAPDDGELDLWVDCQAAVSDGECC